MDARARAGAPSIGVDRLCWELTDHPGERVLAAVRARRAGARRASGTRSGTTTTSATRFPAPRRAPRIDVRTLRWPAALPRCPLTAAAGARRPPDRGPHARARTCRRARSRRRPRYGRRLVPPRRAAVRRRRRAHQSRFRARWLPQTLRAGRAGGRRRSTIPAPEQPGRYTLKFDLVSEGNRLVRALRIAKRPPTNDAAGSSG